MFAHLMVSVLILALRSMVRRITNVGLDNIKISNREDDDNSKRKEINNDI